MFANWFNSPGAYVLVDGQFGSTGKGLLAGRIAQEGAGKITHVTTNAGPNSGHTAYFDGVQVMTQQLPVASVFLDKMGLAVNTLINAGAIVDSDILFSEIMKFDMSHRMISVHPNAALISERDREEDKGVVSRIAGTGKGIGPAQARKIARNGVAAICRPEYGSMLPADMGADFSFERFFDWRKDVVFVETAQGFSLGVNSMFYPHTTSRECTVMQAISDARIPAQMVKGVVVCFRTYPIRVGNTATGNSGDCYGDQREMTWDEIGVTPEMTTVTKRVRRVFTWSRQQFMDCIAANQPDKVFLNFCNYMSDRDLYNLVATVLEDYDRVMGNSLNPDDLILGFGPNSADLMSARSWMQGERING